MISEEGVMVGVFDISGVYVAVGVFVRVGIGLRVGVLLGCSVGIVVGMGVWVAVGAGVSFAGCEIVVGILVEAKALQAVSWSKYAIAMTDR